MQKIILANNSYYISLSNQMAKKTQLEVVANNIANTSTTGYEQEAVLFNQIDTKHNSKRNYSFVGVPKLYRSGDVGSLKFTNNPLDVAIVGDGYFKIITPKGDRYSLDGSMMISNQNILINISGYPYANVNGEPIIIPEDFQQIDIAEDGTIYVDDEDVDVIGIYRFESPDPFVREGGRLYRALFADITAEDYSLISGAVRQSNVNATATMAEMVEMQRSISVTNNLMSNINELEKSVITRLGK